MTRRAALIVLDGLGIGPAHDTAAYGDTGSDTLGNTLRQAGGVELPNLAAFGLGNIAPLPGVPAVAAPRAAYGVAEPVSAGKDSTTGHWELTGCILERPFPTYPQGFPAEVIAEFARRTGRGVIGNVAGSGTALLDRFGAAHVASGDWIVYTSADSVFQVAAHEDVVPLEELYAACAEARRMLAGAHGVSRVIARPFVGGPGAWTRTPRRKDFSLEAPAPTLVDLLAEAGIPRRGVGKVDDLFAGRNLTSTHTATNAEAYDLIERALGEMASGFLFVNVIEFDQSWGHRNDVAGFVGGLRELDARLPRLLAPVRPDDLVIFTADHGNDPTTPSTDHAREVVPVLAYGPWVHPVALGRRRTFADLGQTIAEYLGVGPLAAGTSFLRELQGG
ncbi:MAG TPA: phosphopentomutase [Gemmatimonadales bacterium]|nr:phosphopentomutase [Gemmatimonadales bacterium]